ncbi:MAG: hypothetical protein AB1765_11505, partial [Candidatus Hydrogenedentota bacterium]
VSLLISLILIFIPLINLLVGNKFNIIIFQTGIFLNLAFLIFWMYSIYDTYRLTKTEIEKKESKIGILFIINLLLFIIVLFNTGIIIILIK